MSTENVEMGPYPKRVTAALKPENIMVGTKDDRKGHVWLLDFGIAKVEDGGLNTD